MAGLLQGLPGGPPMNQGMTTRADVAGGMMPMDAPREGGEQEPNVSEEEQAEYERVVKAGLELVYKDDRVRPGILELLDEDVSDLVELFGPDIQQDFGPKTALAATTAVVCLELTRQDPGIDGGILLHAGTAILEELGEIAEQAGSAEFTPQDLSDALLIALDLYREAAQAEGLIDVEAAKADFAKIQEADKTGDLASVGLA